MADLNDPESYHYTLPAELIAHQPVPKRSESRLMASHSGGGLEEAVFRELGGFLRRGDLLVFNDTRVVPCRLFAKKPTGGRVEVFVIDGDWRSQPNEAGVHVKAMLRSNKTLREGLVLTLGESTFELESPENGGIWSLRLRGAACLGELVKASGEMPLPPYIRRRRRVLGEREERDEDKTRYQTVYAKPELEEMGAVAAPTAGLHFTDALLEGLASEGVERSFVTLHVGIGTFKPLGEGGLDQQRLHSERYEVGSELVEAIARASRDGGRVIAVGTTSARALEDQGQRWGGRKVVAGKLCD